MEAFPFIILLLPHLTLCHRLNTVLNEDRDEEWEIWKRKYGKTYDTETEVQRKANWMKNWEFVFNHDNRVDKSFEVELNQFADQERVAGSSLGPVSHEYHTDDILHFDNNLNFLPREFDWRKKGAVTPVMDQGQLGDAESFAATECVESYNFNKTGRLVKLSVQETHDCCGGHLLYPIFDCIHRIGGLCSEADYPSGGHTCRNASCTPVVQINGGKTVPEGREDMLQKAVLQIPVMAAIDASHPSFQLYKSGVYDDPGCSPTKLDHVVQIVGYGTDGTGNDYWIVRNSWGADWGMNGYILMSRNKNNQCGIASSAMYPY